jgi:hypothetical protein
MPQHECLLFEWQQTLLERLGRAPCVSCWYVVPETGVGKTWMSHHLTETCGALNTYPLDSCPLTHTVQTVQHYIADDCNCDHAIYHRLEDHPPAPTQHPASAQHIVVFDMCTGCSRIKHRLLRVSPLLTSSHVVVFTDRPPDHATLALCEWEIVHLWVL